MGQEGLEILSYQIEDIFGNLLHWYCNTIYLLMLLIPTRTSTRKHNGQQYEDDSFQHNLTKIQKVIGLGK